MIQDSQVLGLVPACLTGTQQTGKAIVACRYFFAASVVQSASKPRREKLKQDEPKRNAAVQSVQRPKKNVAHTQVMADPNMLARTLHWSLAFRARLIAGARG